MLSVIAAVALGVTSARRELQTEPHPWCNVYTCGLSTCSQAEECALLSNGEYCAAWCHEWTASFAHCVGCYSPAPIAYTYTTNVLLHPTSTIRPYEKIRSASCGYATVTGAVFSDTSILTELLPRTFYGFYDGASGLGYVTDAAMTGPEACEAYCNAEPTCAQFYYQYEFTNSSVMNQAPAVAPRWMHKCQLSAAFAAGCGTVFAGDANDYDEFAGRVSAAGAK